MIAVTGRALDERGKPVPKAKVYLAAMIPGAKRLAETTTDKDGKYRFHNVSLPTRLPDADNKHEWGGFAVFATAEGHAVTWRPSKTYFPGGNPWKNTRWKGNPDLPVAFGPEDEIILDLQFRRPATFSGQVVDEDGKPLVGVELDIRGCGPIPQGGFTNDRMLRARSMNHAFGPLNLPGIVPDAIKLRKTDAQGRFFFNGLPRNHRLRIFIVDEKFPLQTIIAATAQDAKKFEGGTVLHTDGMKLTLARPVPLPVRAVYADTNKPASNVLVWGKAVGKSGSHFAPTDAQGRAVVNVVRGPALIRLYPLAGTPYLETEQFHRVDREPPKSPVVVKLPRAATVEVTVVDQTTGKPIPDVDLWEVTSYITRGNGLPAKEKKRYARTAWKEGESLPQVVQHVTGKQGKIRAFFAPGTHTIGVGLKQIPPGYAAVKPNGQEVECKAGENVRVTFKLRK